MLPRRRAFRPVVYLSAEDDLDELNRRIEAIAANYGVPLADLGDFHLVPLAGRDAVLGAPLKPGVIAATPIWRGLGAVVERIRPRLVIVDTLADAYAGNENSRPEARQFVGLLRGMAIDRDLAVVLLAHPSLSGLTTGSGTSGRPPGATASGRGSISTKSRMSMARTSRATSGSSAPRNSITAPTP